VPKLFERARTTLMAAWIYSCITSPNCPVYNSLPLPGITAASMVSKSKAHFHPYQTYYLTNTIQLVGTSVTKTEWFWPVVHLQPVLLSFRRVILRVVPTTTRWISSTLGSSSSAFFCATNKFACSQPSLFPRHELIFRSLQHKQWNHHIRVDNHIP